MNQKNNRKRLFSIIFITAGMIAIIILTFWLQQIQAQSQQKGLVTYVSGNVKKRTADAPNWIRAEKNSAVISGDKVRTYRESLAELELMEIDIIRMAPQTILDVIKLYEETREKRREVKINLEQGDVWANVSKEKGQVKFDIATPLTVAAITGTTLRLSFDSDSTTQLKVYRGQVNITNAPQNLQLQPKLIKPQQIPGPYEVPGPREVSVEQWMYIVKSMQQITVNRQGRVVNQGEFSLNDVDEQSDWIKWNLRRDRLHR